MQCLTPLVRFVVDLLISTTSTPVASVAIMSLSRGLQPQRVVAVYRDFNPLTVYIVLKGYNLDTFRGCERR